MSKLRVNAFTASADGFGAGRRSGAMTTGWAAAANSYISGCSDMREGHGGRECVLQLLDDDTARDAVARVSSRVANHVIGLSVDHKRRSATREHRVIVGSQSNM
jgi:hypothetical protein